MRYAVALLILLAACGDTNGERYSFCPGEPCSYPSNVCIAMDSIGRAYCRDGVWVNEYGQWCPKPENGGYTCNANMPLTYKGEQPWCHYQKLSC